MTKWHGTVVHLHVEKLQPRGHVHWTYRVPAAVSQSREFRPKNRFFLKSTQNRLKRIANHYKKQKSLKKTKKNPPATEPKGAGVSLETLAAQKRLFLDLQLSKFVQKKHILS